MKKNWMIALLIFVVVLTVYVFFCKKTYEALHYFLPLANAFLKGQLNIVGFERVLNELVGVNGRYFVVYPPMPAIALIPFALFFEMAISQVYPAIIYASLAVAFFFLVLTRLTKPKSALILAGLLAFGTNFFMISLIGRSWYFAHVMAVFFLALSLYFALVRKPFLSGIFLGAAGLSRLPLFLAAPAILYLLTRANLAPKFHLRGGIWRFCLPVVVAATLYGFYNFVRFGSFFETGYSLIPGVLAEPWFSKGIFSFSYISRGLEAMLLTLPRFIDRFPFLQFSPVGMALWATTPALLMILLSLKNRLSQVMSATAVLILIPSLMHGSVGFSQFGYRFSLDAILLLIIAMIPAIEKWPKIAYALIILSIIINLYAVILFKLGIFNP